MKRIAIVFVGLTLAGCRHAYDAPPPNRIEPAVLSTSGIPRPRRLFGLHPNRTRAGKGFQVQGGGDSAVLVTGWGFTRGDRAFWNGVPLATSFADATMISALVPKAFLDRPGSARLEVRDMSDSSAPVLSADFVVTP